MADKNKKSDGSKKIGNSQGKGDSSLDFEGSSDFYEPIENEAEDSFFLDNGDDDEEKDGEGIISFWESRKWKFFWWTVLVLIIIVIVWPFSVVNIKPGHVGVLYRRFMGGTVTSQIYNEGSQLILPWNTMYIFDTRLQEISMNIQALNSLGLEMDLAVTLLFRPIQSQTPAILATLGQDYSTKFLTPMLRSNTTNVVARHITEDFFDENLAKIENELLVDMLSNLGRSPIILESILVRRVTLPDSVTLAINDKLIARQKVEEQKIMVELAIEEYKQAFVRASAVKLSGELVNPQLSLAFLRWQGIEATKALAAGNNTKVVLIGGHDGLPVILNLEGGDSNYNDSNAGFGRDTSSYGNESLSSKTADYNESTANSSAEKAEPLTLGAAPPKDPVPSEDMPNILDRVNLESLQGTTSTILEALGLTLNTNTGQSGSPQSGGEQPSQSGGEQASQSSAGLGSTSQAGSNTQSANGQQVSTQAGNEQQGSTQAGNGQFGGGGYQPGEVNDSPSGRSSGDSNGGFSGGYGGTSYGGTRSGGGQYGNAPNGGTQTGNQPFQGRRQ
jgi:regulator of protease activity HflC (stomatin/prohibitin superfamily)